MVVLKQKKRLPEKPPYRFAGTGFVMFEAPHGSAAIMKPPHHRQSVPVPRHIRAMTGLLPE